MPREAVLSKKSYVAEERDLFQKKRIRRELEGQRLNADNVWAIFQSSNEPAIALLDEIEFYLDFAFSKVPLTANDFYRVQQAGRKQQVLDKPPKLMKILDFVLVDFPEVLAEFRDAAPGYVTAAMVYRAQQSPSKLSSANDQKVKTKIAQVQQQTEAIEQFLDVLGTPSRTVDVFGPYLDEKRSAKDTLKLIKEMIREMKKHVRAEFSGYAPPRRLGSRSATVQTKKDVLTRIAGIGRKLKKNG